MSGGGGGGGGCYGFPIGVTAGVKGGQARRGAAACCTPRKSAAKPSGWGDGAGAGRRQQLVGWFLFSNEVGGML